MPWVQGYLGDASKTDVPAKYGVEGIPSVFLVSPEGKIIAKGLSGSSVNAHLAKWLKSDQAK